MSFNKRISRINQLHQEIVEMLSKRSFNQKTEAPGDLQDPIQIFLTNSGINGGLYNSEQGYRAIQNALDCDRFGLVQTLLEADNTVLVMGDPRLDKLGMYKYVPYKNDERKGGPWIQQVGKKRWRAQQAEVWLYQVYLKYIKQRHVNSTRLIFVSSYPDWPYHRVSAKGLPEDLVRPLQETQEDPVTIELPRKTFVFDPPHPKWPSGVVWVPAKLTRVEYSVPIRVYGLGVSVVYHTDQDPRLSIRDLWMIENCADIAIAFHDGKSKATKWNYSAAVRRGIPSILITFNDPTVPTSRRLEWRRVEQELNA